MKIKKISELLDTVDRACKKYSIPEADVVLVDDSEISSIISVGWLNHHKIYLDIFPKLISVYSLKSTIEGKEFKDLDQAIKYVVQFV